MECTCHTRKIFIYKVCVKCLDKIQDCVSYTKTREKLLSVYVHKWFLRYSPRMC